MKDTITNETTIGEIVAADYRAAGIFERHGIDFCCGGRVSIAEACKNKGIELATLTEELRSLQHEPVDRSQNYSSWSLAFLADYIINTHHVYLKENDDQIVAYARKIASVHGSRHPEVVKIAAIFEKIAIDMVAHLKEEEEVFFPSLKRAESARTNGSQPEIKDRETIKNSLVRLHREHEEVGDAIHEIRRLANGFRIPDDVCNTFMLTYRKLDEFEEDLHKHVHLENNILFLKAAQL